MKRLLLLLASGLIITATPAWADSTFTLTDDFVLDGIPYPATLQYSAPSSIPDGTYEWGVLAPTFNIDFGSGNNFTQDDLETTSTEVDVEIRGSYFLFTNNDTFGDGIAGGAADFVNSADDVLSTQPGAPGGDFVGSGFTNTPGFEIGTTGVGLEDVGTYGAAVPEPSDWAWVAVLGTLGIVIVRRRSQRTQPPVFGTGRIF